MASKWLKTLGSIAQFAAPILGGVIGGPAGAAIGGAAGGALSGKKGTAKQMALGAGLGYGGAKLGGVQGQGFGNLISNPLKSIGNAFSNINPFGSSTAYAATAAPAASTAAPMATATNPALAAKAMGQTSASSQSGLGGLMKNPLLLGLGTMVGSQFIRSPKVPDLPQSVIDFQNTARSGNPLQNTAESALMSQLSQTQQNLGQPEIDALNRQYDIAQEDELKQIDSMYKSLRPGTDPLTDTAYQKDLGRVRDRYAALRADSIAQAQRQISNDFQAQRANQIAQAAGLSQQQLQQLSQLSQFDLDRQLSQLNIDYQDKSTLRNYLLQLGGNIASSQFEQNPFEKLFGGV